MMKLQAWKGIKSAAVATVALLTVCVPALGHAQAIIRDTEIEAFLKKNPVRSLRRLILILTGFNS